MSSHTDVRIASSSVCSSWEHRSSASIPQSSISQRWWSWRYTNHRPLRLLTHTIVPCSRTTRYCAIDQCPIPPHSRKMSSLLCPSRFPSRAIGGRFRFRYATTLSLNALNFSFPASANTIPQSACTGSPAPMSRSANDTHSR
jgi:hypothetical protein